MNEVTFNDLPKGIKHIMEVQERILKEIANLRASQDKGNILKGSRAIGEHYGISPGSLNKLIVNGAPIYKTDGGKSFCYTNEMDEYFKKNNPFLKHQK